MCRDPDRQPTHRGELLREDVIPAMGKARTELAELLALSPQELDDILAERAPVTPEVAEGLARLIGNAPPIWIRMQNTHNIWKPR